jgi:hypothetical protein
MPTPASQNRRSANTLPRIGSGRADKAQNLVDRANPPASCQRGQRLPDHGRRRSDTFLSVPLRFCRYGLPGEASCRFHAAARDPLRTFNVLEGSCVLTSFAQIGSVTLGGVQRERRLMLRLSILGLAVLAALIRVAATLICALT